MPLERPVANLQTALGLVLHPHPCDERPWNYLPVVLMLAFVARAAVALSGEFVLHPDEVMQYLEPAHRLAFGHGVRYWEYFYGARSWILPGAIAGVLKLFDAVGLDQPFWYVGGVKLAFCAVSLLVPAGMYFFGRRHFGRRDDNELPVRQWHAYSPIVVSEFERHVLRWIDPYGPVPPTNAGIRFTGPLPPPGGPEIR